MVGITDGLVVAVVRGAGVMMGDLVMVVATLGGAVRTSK